MNSLMKNALVYRKGRLRRLDMAVQGGRIASLSEDTAPGVFDEVFDFSGLVITPGFVDVHVHLREPGFSYKETIESGTRAAARGGYTHVCAMPNLDPPPDSLANLRLELEAIARDAVVRVSPYGTLTIGRQGAGEPADYRALGPHVVAFSDDGTGVQSAETMEACMRDVKAAHGIVAAHCEDESLLCGGYIHDGDYARAHGHAGIPSESEWAHLKRDLALAERIGCRYHACHISTKESVRLIREAKARGVDVTCETAPHYLALTDADLEDDGRFKMNPPIRGRADRDALIAGLIDGTIDMVATDHAPHSAREKAGGLTGSAMGVVGLETAFPVLYTNLVLSGIMTLEQLLERMCDAPRRRFELAGGIEVGGAADFSVLDLKRRYVIDPGEFASMGRATPFEGMAVAGRCVLTVVGGKVVHRDLSN